MRNKISEVRNSNVWWGEFLTFDILLHTEGVLKLIENLFTALMIFEISINTVKNRLEKINTLISMCVESV